MPDRRSPLRPTLLALCGALLALPAAAPAAVTSSLMRGTLRVSSNGADAITVDCVRDRVRVNRARPAGRRAGCDAVERIAIAGGPGSNRVAVSGFDIGTYVSVVITGGAGDDRIRCAGGDCRASGGAGDDVLRGGLGGDRLAGGPGDDTLQGYSEYDTLTGGPGSDRLVGGGDVNEFVFGPANDPEVDTIVAGLGRDRLSFAGLAAGDGVTVDLGVHEGVLAAHANRTVLRDPANVRKHVITSVGGGAGDDTLTGDEEATDLAGGPGHDRLSGGTSRDFLVGGPGDDVLDGGPGDDRYTFDTPTGRESDTVVEAPDGGIDELSFFPSNAPVIVDLSATGTTVVTGSTRTVLVAEPGMAASLESATGGAGDDVLIGNAAANTLNGEAGSDQLAGGGGADVLLGDVGADQLLARDDTRDRVDGGLGRDTAELDAEDSISGVELRRYGPARAA